jgi:hypothetical protein
MTYVHFFLKKRKKKKRKKTIVSDKPPIIHCHLLPHKKENTMELLRTQWKGRFGHRMVSHAPPKGHERHSRVGASSSRLSIFFK